MKALKMSKPPDDAIRDILRFSLEKKKVQAVFSLSKIEGNGYAYALISNKDLLSNICPTFPLMPVNSARRLKSWSREGKRGSGKVAPEVVN